GRPDEPQACQASVEVGGLIFDVRILGGPEPLGPVAAFIRGYRHRLAIPVCSLASVDVPVMRVGIFHCAGRVSCGRRPVVWSAGGTGPAVGRGGPGPGPRPRAFARPGGAARAPAGAGCSAVPAPAETPRTVVAARIVAATSGASPSTTATTTVSAVPGSRSM